jgi:GNAT superfamily N-acetyltransferase
VQILTFPEADAPPALRAQVVGLQDEAWPPARPASGSSLTVTAVPATVTHDPALRPLTMVLVDGGHVLAALDILSKELVHDGRRFAAGGLSAVVTRGEARGRGHGRRLVTAAHEAMRSGAWDLGIFTCDRPLRAFYETAGWRELPGTVLVGGTREAPFPSDGPGFDKVTMGDFFTPRARRHRAGFSGTRVALHPGTTDRLW